MIELLQLLVYGAFIGLNLASMITALSWIFKYNKVLEAYIFTSITATCITFWIVKIVMLLK